MISDELTLFFESRPLDGNADIPIYNELQNRILDFIRTHSDTKEFPSEREFAALLKINRRTLHKAIEPLIADGTLIRTRKKTLINRTKETNLKIGASGVQSKQTDKMKQQLRFLVQMTSPDELSFWKMVVKKFEELFPTIQLHIETPVGADPKSEYIARLESGMFDLTELPTYINWKDAFTNHLLPVKESYLKLFDTDDFLSGKWTSSVPELRQFAIPWSLSFQIMEWDTDPAKLQDIPLCDMTVDELLNILPEKISKDNTLFSGYYDLCRDLGVPETFSQKIITKHCKKLLDRFDLAKKNPALLHVRQPEKPPVVSRNYFSYTIADIKNRCTLFHPAENVCYWGGCSSIGINKDSNCIHEAYLFIEFLLSAPIQNMIWNKLHRAPVRVNCLQDLQQFFGIDPVPYLRQCRENPKKYPCPIGCAILPYVESYLSGAISRQEIIENVLRFYS